MARSSDRFDEVRGKLTDGCAAASDYRLTTLFCGFRRPILSKGWVWQGWVRPFDFADCSHLEFGVRHRGRRSALVGL